MHDWDWAAAQRKGTMLQLATPADPCLVIPARNVAGVGLRQTLQPPETLVAGRCATLAGDGYCVERPDRRP